MCFVANKGIICLYCEISCASKTDSNDRLKWQMKSVLARKEFAAYYVAKYLMCVLNGVQILIQSGKFISLFFVKHFIGELRFYDLQVRGKVLAIFRQKFEFLFYKGSLWITHGNFCWFILIFTTYNDPTRQGSCKSVQIGYRLNDVLVRKPCLHQIPELQEIVGGRK